MMSSIGTDDEEPQPVHWFQVMMRKEGPRNVLAHDIGTAICMTRE